VSCRSRQGPWRAIELAFESELPLLSSVGAAPCPMTCSGHERKEVFKLHYRDGEAHDRWRLPVHGGGEKKAVSIIRQTGGRRTLEILCDTLPAFSASMLPNDDGQVTISMGYHDRNQCRPCVQTPIFMDRNATTKLRCMLARVTTLNQGRERSRLLSC